MQILHRGKSQKQQRETGGLAAANELGFLFTIGLAMLMYWAAPSSSPT
jgi:hypothetical protein